MNGDNLKIEKMKEENSQKKEDKNEQYTNTISPLSPENENNIGESTFPMANGVGFDVGTLTVLKDSTELDKKIKEAQNNKKIKQKEEDVEEENKKEASMRIEHEKYLEKSERELTIRQEKERQKMLKIFDNEPVFKEILKSINKKISYIFIVSIIVILYNSIYLATNNLQDIFLTQFILSAVYITLTGLWFLTFKFGALHDIYLSKSFRLLSILSFLTSLTILTFQVVSSFILIFKDDVNTNKVLLLILGVIVFIFLLPSVLFSFNLALESFIILIGRKKEYIKIVLQEKNLPNNEEKKDKIEIDDE